MLIALRKSTAAIAVALAVALGASGRATLADRITDGWEDGILTTWRCADGETLYISLPSVQGQPLRWRIGESDWVIEDLTNFFEISERQGTLIASCDAVFVSGEGALFERQGDDPSP